MLYVLLEEELKKLGDLASVLDYSMHREADSILYYHEIKNFVPESEHGIIDTIIQEERRHYVKLSELAQSFSE